MEETAADFTMTFRQLSEITHSQLQELNIPQVLVCDIGFFLTFIFFLTGLLRYNLYTMKFHSPSIYNLVIF